MPEFLTALLAAAFTVLMTVLVESAVRHRIRIDDAVSDLRVAANAFWVELTQARASMREPSLLPIDVLRAATTVGAYASRGSHHLHPRRRSLVLTVGTLMSTLTAEWTSADAVRHTQIVLAMEAVALQWVSKPRSWRGDRGAELLDLMK